MYVTLLGKRLRRFINRYGLHKCESAGQCRSIYMVLVVSVVLGVTLMTYITSGKGIIRMRSTTPKDYPDRMTQVEYQYPNPMQTINPYLQKTIAPNAVAPVEVVPPQVCTRPVQNIYYVKVHKTGSSTLITLLYKHIRKHHLTIFPVTGDPYPSGIGVNTFQAPESKKGMVYNFFGEHAMFHAAAAARLMPSDTQYIASIRYPISHLRSLFVEFAIGSRLKIQDSGDPVATFLSNLDKYEGRVTKTKNFQARTLEYSEGENIQDFISRVKKKFSVMIIAEYFDESLILLRRKFCWKMEDIAYTILRARKYKNKNLLLSKEILSIHKNYSSVDYMMYDFFVNDLMAQIRQQEDFWDEFNLFKNIKENIFLFCDGIISRLKTNTQAIYDMVNNNVHETYDPSPWGEPFNITALDCAMMKLRTRAHRNIMKILQFPEFCELSRKQVPSTHADIHWASKNVIAMHSTYCGKTDSSTGIPLDVMAVKDSYMWIGG